MLTTVRLSPEARALLEALSASCGLSHTAILELAVREKAKREKVTAPRPGYPQDDETAMQMAGTAS